MLPLLFLYLGIHISEIPPFTLAGIPWNSYFRNLKNIYIFEKKMHEIPKKLKDSLLLRYSQGKEA